MRLARFITTECKTIISEWETFARLYVPAASTMDMKERRDHIAGMLKAIAVDLGKPQTKRQQAKKSKGKGDARVGSKSSAGSHGTDRAATGYTPSEMVSEFRALRASVVRLWSEGRSRTARSDLEDLTRFNEAIDQLLAESISTYAQDVERSKDLFIGVLGHDLRNPLGAIMMSASVMMRREGPDWPHLKTASRILTSGTRMDGMIGDLLDFTRSRLGNGIPVVRAAMDMETTCVEAIDEITAFHPRCIVRFKARGQLHGEWDAGRIAQALSNLVGNAYQHGAEDVPIVVAVRGERDHVVLRVHNHGRPIAKGQLRDIFNPFRQLDPTRAKTKDLRSAGLGLYIAQAIVIAHHGTIDVKSTKGGTTFTVSLPRRAPAAPA